MKKRIISMMMCVLLVCSFLPIKAFALSTHALEDAPVFVGIEDNESYCKSVKFKVTDDSGIAQVKADDTTLTADEEGYYILAYNNSDLAAIECVITATDFDGNMTSVSVTIFEDHSMYGWRRDGEDIRNCCTKCDMPGDIRQKAPEAHVVGSDTVCRSEDYKFTVTLPSDCEFMDCMGPYWQFTPQLQDDGTYLCIIENVRNYDGGDSIDMHMEVVFYPASGGHYNFYIDKTVTVIDHKGGTANCKEQAVCTECGNSYGETDPAVHKDALQHVEAKSATTEETGNIEYWYCADCDKYYSDKDGNTEIAKATITVEKLGSSNDNTSTPGETDNTEDEPSDEIEAPGETDEAEDEPSDETVTPANTDDTEDTPSDETVTTEKRDETTTSPATGDNSYIWLRISLMFVCAIGFVSVNFFKKKKLY